MSDDANTDQDYVFNWTRDSAITAVELSAAGLVTNLRDYVAFAALAQNAALAKSISISRGAFSIDGQPRDWSDQSDGPALQTLALLNAWPQLGSATATAQTVIAKNIGYLLIAYPDATTNLWEETSGFSFFARSIQLKCFTDVLAKATTLGLSPTLQSQIQAACTDLSAALDKHWDAGNGRYASILGAGAGARGAALNVDVVMASVYGAVAPTDTKLLATAAQVRDAFANQSSSNFYAINAQDAAQQLGPLIGRYPGDTYDGSVNNGETPGGHPWAPCTCNFAELYYALAAAIAGGAPLVFDALSSPFYAQVGLSSGASATDAVDALRSAGDRMLRAVILHSDHLELSEQFNGVTGFEMSVHNLSWSYASFMSAVRARGRS